MPLLARLRVDNQARERYKVTQGGSMTSRVVLTTTGYVGGVYAEQTWADRAGRAQPPSVEDESDRPTRSPDCAEQVEEKGERRVQVTETLNFC